MPRSQPAGVCCELTPTPAQALTISEYSPATRGYACSEEGKPLELCAGQGSVEGSRQRKVQGRPVWKQQFICGRVQGGMQRPMLTASWEGRPLTPVLMAPLTSLSFTASSNRGHPMPKPVGLQAQSLGGCPLSPLRRDRPNPWAPPHYTSAENAAFRVTSPDYMHP